MSTVTYYTKFSFIGSTVVFTSIPNFEAEKSAALNSADLWCAGSNDLVKDSSSGAYFYTVAPIDIVSGNTPYNFCAYVTNRPSVAKLVLDATGKPYGLLQPNEPDRFMYVKADRSSSFYITGYMESTQATPIVMRSFSPGVFIKGCEIVDAANFIFKIKI